MPEEAAMYDPKIGRWMTEDPIEFEAADPDLYRYAHNDPTNATDPSGLKDKKPDFEGTFKFPYQNEEKDKKIAEVTVRVTSGVTFKGEDDWIQLQEIHPVYTVKVGGFKGVGDFHWLQFVHRIRKKGKEVVKGGRIKTEDGRWYTYADKEKGYTGEGRILDTDTRGGGAVKIYYDDASPRARKYDRLGGLSIFDAPEVTKIGEAELKRSDFSEIRAIFDSYLVESGKVYYHVHWERVGVNDGDDDWTPHYENVTGEEVKDRKLPKDLFNKNGKLRMGYDGYDGKKFGKPLEVSFP
jgi:hypothetical protein